MSRVEVEDPAEDGVLGTSTEGVGGLPRTGFTSCASMSEGAFLVSQMSPI